ncbi:MAG: NAD(P)H-hydrate dehydratase [bacterium]|nr:NAD(P)H-hydrate dehydratase [bacterium]
MTLQRKTDSHKGQNGRVLVVGGSEVYHGAPLLAALGAEKSGVDLTYLMVPINQQNLARQFSLNLIVTTFSGKFLKAQDVKKVLDWSRKCDLPGRQAGVMVIGNGLGDKPQTLRAIKMILEQAKCKLVIDAAALDAFVKVKSPPATELVLTPHRGEFGRMLGKNLEMASEKELEQLTQEKAKEWGVTLVLKTPQTLICSPEGKIHWNTTGHPIMSKGGTGDVLAGLIAGLMAQGLSGFEAAKEACKKWGEVGEYVAKKKGLMTTVEEMVGGMVGG